jgi:hypothetical protein
MTRLLAHDPVVQRSRGFFALFDWSQAPDPAVDPSRHGKRPHPQSAYVKARLLKREEGMSSWWIAFAVGLSMVLDVCCRPVQSGAFQGF